MTENAPILEFDGDRSAILSPDPYRTGGDIHLPSLGVLCFFQDVLQEDGAERGTDPRASSALGNWPEPGVCISKGRPAGDGGSSRGGGHRWQPVFWRN